MDTVSLASAEARRVRKFRDGDEEEEDRADRDLPAVPLLHVSRDAGHRTSWKVASSGDRGHPNEARMPFIREWLERDVLRVGEQQPEEQDFSGTYRIQLHDSCTYLPRAADFRDILSFCRSTSSACASIATFPDPYQASGFVLGGSPDAWRDEVPWEAKRPTVTFAGSSTGHTDPSKNARVLACLWALDHPRETDFRISALVQMRPYDVCRQPRVREVLAPHVSPHVQFRHRFIANIVGNTACWSRVPMVLGSKSVMFHLPHEDAAWYYPAMRAGVHYVDCGSLDGVLLARQGCLSDDAGCRRMTAEANLFSARYLTRGAAVQYARCLLADIRGK